MADLEGKINLSGPAGTSYGGGPSDGPVSPTMQANEGTFKNTLDEPVLETIKRDLKMIFYKLKYVMHPKMREEAAKELRNWDLWGPLLLCLLLAFILTLASDDQDDTIFGTIFIIIWGGACILTLNAKFLGGKISFFQSVCVLGYCVFPIVLASGFVAIINLAINQFILNLVICGLGSFWAITSSIGFIRALVTEQKKMLAAYPVILFYLALTWFVLLAFAK